MLSYETWNLVPIIHFDETFWRIMICAMRLDSKSRKYVFLSFYAINRRRLAFSDVSFQHATEISFRLNYSDKLLPGKLLDGLFRFYEYLDKIPEIQWVNDGSRFTSTTLIARRRRLGIRFP